MLHLMTIVLIILKATGYLSISWWLVFAPSIFVLLMLVFSIGFLAWANSR